MSTTYKNRFKSTQIRERFQVTADSELQGDLYLGKEVEILNGNGVVTGYTDTGGSLKWKIAGVEYSLPLTKLVYLTTVNADVQNQIDAKPSMNYLNTQIAGVEELISELDVANQTSLDALASGLQTQLNDKVSSSVLSSTLSGYVDTLSQQTIAGAKTFSVYPKVGGTQDPVDDRDVSTKSYVDSNILYLDQTKASTSYVDQAVAGIPLDGLVTQTELNNYVTTTSLSNQLASTITQLETYTDTAVSNVQVDLTGYATETYVNNAISNVQVDLTGYATETYVNNAINAIDLSGYVQDSELTSALLDKVDVTSYNTSMDAIAVALNGKVASSTYTSGMAEKVDVSTYNTAIAGINTSLDGKASTQSLVDGLATKVDNTTYSTAIAGINTSLDGKASTQSLTDGLALCGKLGSSNTWSGTNGFQGVTTTTFSTSGLTYLNGTTLQINPGACFVNDSKGFNMMGGPTVYNSGTSGTAEITGVYRDTSANGGNLIFSQNYAASQGGGFQFYTRNRATGTGGNLALNIQDSGITSSVPFSFSGSAPSCTTTPTLTDHLVRKGYVDAAISSSASTQQAYTDGLIGNCVTLGGNNLYTGTNAYNTSLPTSTLTPTLGTELVTKTYTDGQVNLCGKLSSANTWSASNTFSAVTNTFSGTDLVFAGTSVTTVRLGYLSTLSGNVQTQLNARGTLTGTNAWSGANSFSQLPTSSAATWTLPAQFGTQSLCDARYAQLDGGNTFGTGTSVNLFNSQVSFAAQVNFTSSTAAINCNGTNIIAGNLAHLSGSSSNIQTQLNGKAGTGANTFTGAQTINNSLSVSVNAAAQITCSNPNVGANSNLLRLYVPSTANQFIYGAAAGDAMIVAGSSTTAGNLYIGLHTDASNQGGIYLNRTACFMKSSLVCNSTATFANAGEMYQGPVPSVASLGTKLLAPSSGTELTMVRLTIPANSIKTTIYSAPVSVFRQGTLPIATNITHTHRLDSITAKIYSDAGVFIANAAVSFSGSTLGVTTRSMSSASLTSWSYEQYFGRCQITYQFPNLATSTVYQIRIVVAETYSYVSTSTPTATSAGYYFNTAVSNTSGANITFSDASPSGYAVASITTNLSQSVAETYGDNSGCLGASGVVTRELTVNEAAVLPTTTATALTVSGDARFNGNVVMKSPVGVYSLDGSSPYNPTPIFCSLKAMSPDNVADYFVVFPGYSINVYRDLNYSTLDQFIDNISGVSPISVAATSPNAASSCKLFYLGVEVTLAPFS